MVDPRRLVHVLGPEIPCGILGAVESTAAVPAFIKSCTYASVVTEEGKSSSICPKLMDAVDLRFASRLGFDDKGCWHTGLCGLQASPTASHVGVQATAATVG